MTDNCSYIHLQVVLPSGDVRKPSLRLAAHWSVVNCCLSGAVVVSGFLWFLIFKFKSCSALRQGPYWPNMRCEIWVFLTRLPSYKIMFLMIGVIGK